MRRPFGRSRRLQRFRFNRAHFTHRRYWPCRFNRLSATADAAVSDILRWRYFPHGIHVRKISPRCRDETARCVFSSNIALSSTFLTISSSMLYPLLIDANLIIALKRTFRFGIFLSSWRRKARGDEGSAAGRLLSWSEGSAKVLRKRHETEQGDEMSSYSRSGVWS